LIRGLSIVTPENTTRKGFEAAVGWLFTPSWRLGTGALTLASYEFDTFKKRMQTVMIGKQVTRPGQSKTLESNRLQWHGLGWVTFAVLETHYVGSVVANDANDTKSWTLVIERARRDTPVLPAKTLLRKLMLAIRNLDRPGINLRNVRYQCQPMIATLSLLPVVPWYAGSSFVF